MPETNHSSATGSAATSNSIQNQINSAVQELGGTTPDSSTSDKPKPQSPAKPAQPASKPSYFTPTPPPAAITQTPQLNADDLKHIREEPNVNSSQPKATPTYSFLKYGIAAVILFVLGIGISYLIIQLL